MVSPSARGEAVRWLLERRGTSLQRACRVLGLECPNCFRFQNLTLSPVYARCMLTDGSSMKIRLYL
jgi:hypothetical protein